MTTVTTLNVTELQITHSITPAGPSTGKMDNVCCQLVDKDVHTCSGIVAMVTSMIALYYIV